MAPATVALIVNLIRILGPVISVLAPLIKPFVSLISDEIAERLDDHAEYSRTDASDDALGDRLRNRIERVWPGSDRRA